MRNLNEIKELFDKLEARWSLEDVMTEGQRYLQKNHGDFRMRISKTYRENVDVLKWPSCMFLGVIGFFLYCRELICDIHTAYPKDATLLRAMKIMNDYDAEMYPFLMELYFQTPFKEGCDYGLMHFLSEGVLMNRMYEASVKETNWR